MLSPMIITGIVLLIGHECFLDIFELGGGLSRVAPHKTIHIGLPYVLLCDTSIGLVSHSLENGLSTRTIGLRWLLSFTLTGILCDHYTHIGT